MATDKRPTILRLPETMFQKIKAISVLEHRSMNLQIEHALELYIKEYESIHGSIEIEEE